MTYLDRSTGRVRTVELVLPEHSNAGEGRVSVLSPLGAALLGLAEGALFRWQAPSEVALDVKILGVGHRDASRPGSPVQYYRRPPLYPSNF